MNRSPHRRHVDKKFSTDGVTFSDNITVTQGSTLTERIYYGDRSDTAGLTATHRTHCCPAGFTLVANSTKNCLNPTAGETVCNTDVGQRWCNQRRRGLERADADDCANRRSLRGASRCHQWPLGSRAQALLQPARGRLSARHRTILAQWQCNVAPMSRTRPIQWLLVGVLVATHPRAINPRSPSTCWAGATSICTSANTCKVPNNSGRTSSIQVPTPPTQPIQWPLVQGLFGGHNHGGNKAARANDLQAQRYFNLHECQYLQGAEQFRLNVVAAGTNTSNTADAVASCAATSGGTLEGQLAIKGCKPSTS